MWFPQDGSSPDRVSLLAKGIKRADAAPRTRRARPRGWRCDMKHGRALTLAMVASMAVGVIGTSCSRDGGQSVKTDGVAAVAPASRGGGDVAVGTSTTLTSLPGIPVPVIGPSV